MNNFTEYFFFNIFLNALFIFKDLVPFLEMDYDVYCLSEKPFHASSINIHFHLIISSKYCTVEEI